MNWIEDIIKEHNDKLPPSYATGGMVSPSNITTIWWACEIDQAADDIIDEFNDVDYD